MTDVDADDYVGHSIIIAIMPMNGEIASFIAELRKAETKFGKKLKQAVLRNYRDKATKRDVVT